MHAEANGCVHVEVNACAREGERVCMRRRTRFAVENKRTHLHAKANECVRTYMYTFEDSKAKARANVHTWRQKQSITTLSSISNM